MVCAALIPQQEDQDSDRWDRNRIAIEGKVVSILIIVWRESL